MDIGVRSACSIFMSNDLYLPLNPNVSPAPCFTSPARIHVTVCSNPCGGESRITNPSLSSIRRFGPIIRAWNLLQATRERLLRDVSAPLCALFLHIPRWAIGGTVPVGRLADITHLSYPRSAAIVRPRSWLPLELFSYFSDSLSSAFSVTFSQLLDCIYT